METRELIDGLLMYLGLVLLLTFHEFGHAWMAWKCGDDTARLQGRVSLNPLVHIDLLGTVILPLAMIFLPAVGGFLIGWAKPVPVNPSNLRNKRTDDILVTLAGPWMNLLLAVVLVVLAKIGTAIPSPALVEVASSTAKLSLLLFFFNLIPVPPLDGSQVVRTISGMSYETYHRIARFGFFILIVLLQIPLLRHLMSAATSGSYRIIADWVRLAA